MLALTWMTKRSVADQLKRACDTDNSVAVDRLFKEGAHIDGKDRQGVTLLGKAAQKGSAKVCNLLIDLGVDIDSCNAFGWTALHWAAFGDHAVACTVLLKGGADPLLLNHDGCSARDIAQKWGNGACLDVFHAWAARDLIHNSLHDGVVPNAVFR